MAFAHRVCNISALFFMLQVGHCLDLAKFTNIQCSNLDDGLVEFSMCRLRAVKRNVNELTLKVKVLQASQKNVSMRLQLMKKASGYKPFLYDVSVDVCDYLEKRNHPFVNIIFNSFGNYSGGVHKCPLSREIVVENFPFPEKALKAMPLPAGDYALFATFSTNSVVRAIVKTYFVLADILAV